MKRVVVESPYAGEVELNVAYAKRCVKDCLRRNEAPYASHLFFTQPGILDDDVPEERQRGIEAGFAWGAAADLVAFYIDRGWSKGMLLGFAEACLRGAVVDLRALDRDVTAADWEYADELSYGAKIIGASESPVMADVETPLAGWHTSVGLQGKAHFYVAGSPVCGERKGIWPGVQIKELFTRPRRPMAEEDHVCGWCSKMEPRTCRCWSCRMKRRGAKR